MPSSMYTNIRNAVEATDRDNDSVLFHQTVDILALILGFTETREWYEAETNLSKPFTGKIFNFTSFSNLEACIKSGIMFNYFERNFQYEKDGDSFTASTLYKDFMSFRYNKFKLFTVTSESTLGLEYDIISFKEFKLRFPQDDPVTLLMRAFKSRCLIQWADKYIMSPRYLLRLAEQQGVFR